MEGMLKAGGLGGVVFDVIAWGSPYLKDIAPFMSRGKIRGRSLKKQMLAGFSSISFGSTYIVPAFQLASHKCKREDAILVFTDAVLHDSSEASRDSTCKSYLEKNKHKIIWVLTTGGGNEDGEKQSQLATIRKFSSYSVSHNMYIKFRKKS